MVDSGRLGKRSPCMEAAVRIGLDGFGGHFGRFRSVGRRSPGTERTVRTGLDDFGGHFGRFRSVGKRSPGTKRTVRTVLAPRGAADHWPERLGQRRRTVSVPSEGRVPLFAAGSVPSRRTDPTHTQMKLEESKPRRILRSVFELWWSGRAGYLSQLMRVWTILTGFGCLFGS